MQSTAGLVARRIARDVVFLVAAFMLANDGGQRFWSGEVLFGLFLLVAAICALWIVVDEWRQKGLTGTPRYAPKSDTSPRR